MAATIACGGDTDPAAPGDQNNGATNTPGRADLVITVDGMQRAFTVYVGSSVGATTAVPVVFMLHGTSGDGPQFFNISKWREKADAEGLIAVFPSGLTYCFHEDENHDGDFSDPGEEHVNSKWTSGDVGDPARLPLCTAQELAALSAGQRSLADHPLKDDLAFFDAMVAYLEGHYRVDAKAIYVAGFSNGAQMSNRLATERSQVVAATDAHAGPLSVPPTNGRQMSAVVSVGNLDDRFTAALGVSVIPLGESTLQQYPLLAALLITPMLAQLKLTQTYTYDEQIIAGKRVCRWTFHTSTAGASNSLQFLLVEGAEHEYPNGENHPVTMANVIWPFFKTQRLP
jgi:polyhydroxybutyrate depolymerase